MRYLILVSLLICYVLFIKDAKAAFTKDDCLNCCNGLIINTTGCIHACNRKFYRSQEYNGRGDCTRSCLVALSGCKNICVRDCEERYPPGRPGKREPARSTKEKRKRQEAREAAGFWRKNKPFKDPNDPRIKPKPNNDKDGEGGSSAVT